MYIVAIAWMYVVVLMAAAQDSVPAGLGTLVFYGLIPCSILMYVLRAGLRARQSKSMPLSPVSRSDAEHRVGLIKAEQTVENLPQKAQ